MSTPNSTTPQRLHNEAYVRKHCQKVRHLLRKYRRDSRKAAKALIGEMAVIKATLEGEICALHSINPDDRQHLEQNAEQTAAALDSYLDENIDPRWNKLRKIALVIGAAFIAAGALFLLLALLAKVPKISPLVQTAIKWVGLTKGDLLRFGLPLATVGGIIVPTLKK